MSTRITVTTSGGDALLQRGKQEVQANRLALAEKRLDTEAAEQTLAELEESGYVKKGGFRVEAGGEVIAVNANPNASGVPGANVIAPPAPTGRTLARNPGGRVEFKPAASRGQSIELGHGWSWANFEDSNSQDFYFQGPYNYLTFSTGTVETSKKRELRLASADGTRAVTAVSLDYTISGLPDPGLQVISNTPDIGLNSNGEPISLIRATANVIKQAFNSSGCFYFVLPAGGKDFVIVIASYYTYGFHHRRQSFNWTYVTGESYLNIDSFTGQQLVLGPWGISNDNSRAFSAYAFKAGVPRAVSIPSKVQSILDKLLPPPASFAYQHRTGFDTYESINYERITPGWGYDGPVFTCSEGYPDDTSEAVYTPQVYRLLNEYNTFTGQTLSKVPTSKKQPLPYWPSGDWLDTGAYRFEDGEVSADPDWLTFFNSPGGKTLPYANWAKAGVRPDMRVYGSKKEELDLPTPRTGEAKPLRLSPSRNGFPANESAVLDKIVVYDWGNPSYCKRMLSELGFDL